MHADPNCLYCKIVAGKLPARVVLDSPHALAFLDIHPRAPGHTLIIPKHHAERLTALPVELVGPLFATVQQVAAKIERGLKPDGLTIGANQGAAGGQEVQHLHIHIIPRFTGDKGGSIQSIVHHERGESLDDILNQITH